MRLLQLQRDGALSLTEDLIHGIPPYAILSHTWGSDNQEVTFQDIQHHTGQHKEGYRKLTFCGQQAASDGLQYFWVDTCCIDKSNSTELSEAINSMFRWYQNAVQCYVYLSDVSVGSSEKRGKSGIPWDAAFRESRWFTRGWTLQELIAPKSVIFFSEDGQQLGDKASLEALLHEITGISIDALRGKPLPIFSVEERLSWRGERRTKRAEDRVYSLLGIFDIYLPLIYGEGEQNAFFRLQDEIHKRAKSCSKLRNAFHEDNGFQSTRPASLRIRQGGSRFQSNITLTGNASSNQGNKIRGITLGDIVQEGSEFSGNVKAGGRAQAFQGNQIEDRGSGSAKTGCWSCCSAR
ncbi:HET domain-containing protein [Microdochium nivale]|nr:HET domain-containing protein [Microdochium nivale]